MIKLALSNANYKWIAGQIHKNLEPEMVIAFSRVECKREPFDKDGFPAILYERHVFDRNVENRANRTKWRKEYPSLCWPKGYGKGGYGSYGSQRVKLSKAMQLDKQAAMEACSWGPFQELGENWKDYGFQNVGEFVDMMKDGLYGASVIFIKSIKHRGLVQPMLDHKYATIALKYNGKGYREFKYDEQIEAEYTAAKKLKIDWDSVTAQAPPRRKGEPVWIGDKLPVVQLVSDTEEEAEASHSDDILDAQTIGDDEPIASNNLNSSGDAGSASSDNLSVEVDNKNNIKIKKEGEPDPEKPKEIIAIEKPDQTGFLSKMWRRIAGFFSGNVGLETVSDKMQQVQAFGLSTQFYERIFYLAIGGTLIYFVVQFYKHWQQKKHELEITKSLVTANSTDSNIVQFVDSWQIPLLQNQPNVKVIMRNAVAGITSEAVNPNLSQSATLFGYSITKH